MTDERIPKRWHDLGYVENPELTKQWEQLVQTASEEPLPDVGIVTLKQVAAQFDAGYGIPGWTAKIAADGKSFEMTPPPGYMIVHGSDGHQQLAKFPTAQIGVSVRKVNG